MSLNDSETEEEMNMDTPLQSTQFKQASTTNLLPAKSRNQYKRAYKFFMNWRRENNVDSFSEDVLLDYFKKLSERMKPSSLWAIYSMLRMTINIKNNIDVSHYRKLCAFLKDTSHGYKPKKSEILTPQQINEFLSTAPDDNYLFTKVGLIFGIMGACRREELMKLETTHVEDLKTALLVHIHDTKNQTERQFVVSGNFYYVCKKYINLRPPNLVNVKRFFLNYQRGKCTKQPIGINKFGSIANHVATFLKLPNPSSYTGHCFRQSSATILVDSGTGVTVLKRQGGCRSSSVAEGYIDHNKIRIDDQNLHTVEDSDDDNFESTENINCESNESTDINFEMPIKIEHTIKEEPSSPVHDEVIEVKELIISEEECENVPKKKKIQQTDPLRPTTSTNGAEWDEQEAFSQYITSCLKQLPAENAISVQCEIIKLLSSERLKVLRNR